MPSTFVHGLLPSACAFFCKPKMAPLSTRERFKLFIGFAFIANCPDLDLIPATLSMGHFHSVHRNLGHNLFALGIWVILGAWLMRKWMPKKQAWWFAGSLVASHVLLDAMQTMDPTNGVIPGVPLLWPLSDWQFRMPFHLFPCLHVNPNENPIWVYATSWDFWRRLVFTEISHILILFAAWVVGVKIFGASTKSVARLRRAKLASLRK